MAGPRIIYFAIPVGTSEHLTLTGAFYETVFGWQQQDSSDGVNYPFTDPRGIFGGMYLLDHSPANHQGSFASIVVNDAVETLGKIESFIETAGPGSRAEVLSGIERVDLRDANAAKFRDPAGNIFGIYQNLPDSSGVTKAIPRYAYIDIPVPDVHELVSCGSGVYIPVFSWRKYGAEHGNDYGFNDEDGYISGVYVVGGQLSDAPGVITYVVVEDYGRTSQKLGGTTIVPTIGVDHHQAFATTFHDHSGNYFGIYQHLPG